MYEFLGDFFDGCPVTFPDRQMRHSKQNNKTMQEVYEETLERLEAIRKAEYKVEVICENEWNQLKREREEVREFVNQLEFVTRLEPRDAFFGGRTNAVQLYQRAQGEEILWITRHCTRGSTRTVCILWVILVS